MQQKDNKISLIRMIATCMIVLCHILQFYNFTAAFWFNIGVQMFLFMSGFLYSKTDFSKINIKSWYTQQFFKILIPFWIIYILVTALNYIIFGLQISRYMIIGNLLGFGSIVGIEKSLSHTWFITYILLSYMITPLLYFIFNKTIKSDKTNIKNLILLSLILFTMYYFRLFSFDAVLLINYCLGYVFSKILSESDSNKIIIGSFLMLSIIVNIIRVLFFYIKIYEPIPDLLNINIVYIESFSHVLLGSSLFIVLYLIFKKTQVKRFKFLDLSDRYSYSVYLVHQVFVFGSLSIFNLKYQFIIKIIIYIGSVLTAAYLLLALNRLVSNALKSKSCYNYSVIK